MDFLARFWDKVQITEGCWLWTGAVCGDGYPRFKSRGVSWPAHRIAYELVTGEPFPGGMDGHHECNTRRCVRPGPEHVEPREPPEHRGMIWKRRRQSRRSTR